MSLWTIKVLPYYCEFKMQERMVFNVEIKGQIEEIIYHNEINSYTVCLIATEDNLVTAVGYLPFINIGDTLILKGKITTHQEYGEQFKIDTFEKIMPETEENLEKYLSSGIIKGVGLVTAKKIVDKFGKDTIYILRFEPEKLTQIKGINQEKANDICETFNSQWDLWQLVIFLEKFGIGANNANKVYKEFGISAIEKINENPYILTDIVYGLNFKDIDKIAMNLGMELTNSSRVCSGIKYAISSSSLNGHTCVLKDNLISFIKDLLQISEDIIEHNLIELNVKNDIIIEKRNNKEWVYLAYFYKTEKNICERIDVIKNSKSSKISNIKVQMEKAQIKADIILSDEQREAIEDVLNNNICIITGGPGTGKTTIIKTIINLFIDNKKKVVLCAPTGRAAKRMTESTGYEAKTLHRLLEIGKIDDDDLHKNIDYEVSPIDADVVIVDEVSMVDMFLMNYLLKGLYMGTKLVLVGDVDQLPSVGPGSVLKDLIISEKIHTVRLNKIFRQAKESMIILNAHRVNKGEELFTQSSQNEIETQLEDENERTIYKKDFFYINEFNQEKILQNILSLSSDRLTLYGNYEFFKDIQILTPTKKGMLGTKELNKELQNILNPYDEYKNERNFGHVILREGDKVIQVKNNYDIIWEKKNNLEVGTGVFNGDLGKIIKIDLKDHIIVVEFDDEKIVNYAFADVEQLEHAYSITIHKSQGSEFNVVIIPISPSSPLLLTRNLLYTGITRAKELLILIGNKDLIRHMIENADVKNRNTGLEYKLTTSIS